MANILGINTGEAGWFEAKAAIEKFYNDGGTHLIVTPNPEIILSAQKDEELFYLLNSADLSLADGFGLKLAAKLSGQKLKRLTGADLLPYLLSEADAKKRKIVIIKPLNGLSKDEDIASVLKEKYPQIVPLLISAEKQAFAKSDDCQKIAAFQADLAICLFGSPEQEKYLHDLQTKIKNPPLAAGLGGAFDFLSGRIKRAPAFMRFMGMEWFWRLCKQPSRWRRIWRATFVFTVKILKWIFIMPYAYRPNVAVLMYRQTEKGKKIFIVERQGQPDHWQLPQGGLDGLDLISAGIKEIKEESGADKLKVIAAYKNLYTYRFDKENGKYKKSSKQSRHFGYRGQKQGLLIVEFAGKDDELRVNYWDHSAWDWVEESGLIARIHPCRREAAALYLKKLNDK